MRHAIRGVAVFGLLSVLTPACVANRPPSLVAAADPHTMQVILHDHLAFGVRLERVSVLLDGESAYQTTDADRQLDRAILTVAPGAHTLAVLAEASEPCGMLDEPRMRLTVRALQTFFLGDRPATLDVDLYASAATSDPAHMISVRFAGDRATIGAAEEGEAAPFAERCEPGDELCALDARIDRARSRGDVQGGACYASHRDDLRRWRDLLEDSFAAVSREGTTTRDAESAQLRARYAESRLRSAVMEARSCGTVGPVHAAPASIERKVDAVCPVPDVTASAQGW
jgi:hypothetical protein